MYKRKLHQFPQINLDIGHEPTDEIVFPKEKNQLHNDSEVTNL